MNSIAERLAAGAPAAIAIYCASAALAGPPDADTSSTDRPRPAMTLGAPVEPPWGYVSLCARSPADCAYEDTPQARAGVALSARAASRARWERAMRLAGQRGVLARPAVAAAVDQPDASAVGPKWDTSQPQPKSALLAGDPWRIELRPFWPLINRVNAQVNRAIRPAASVQAHGVSDWWAAPQASGPAPLGDCKDFALEKRRELIAAGLPARALSIALVRTPAGQSHAVLVVAGGDGDYVLDNLAPEIRLWSRTPYSWQARQSPADPLIWLSVLGQ